MDREDFAASARPDAERPLTPAGRRKLARAARGLAGLLPAPALLVSSPWRRAEESCSIVGAAFGISPGPPVSALEGDRHPRDALVWLASLGDTPLVALVGHEPHLGRLIGWSVGGRDTVSTVLGKAGACLLRFGSRPDRGGARIRWLLRPRQLRQLGRTT